MLDAGPACAMRARPNAVCTKNAEAGQRTALAQTDGKDSNSFITLFALHVIHKEDHNSSSSSSSQSQKIFAVKSSLTVFVLFHPHQNQPN